MIQDKYNRTFSYLRLSVTDICNFRCSYCLPDGYKCVSKEDHLSLDEIHNLITAFAEIGIKKVRVTGGEPTIRKDLYDILSLISDINSIKSIALTTNGYKLPEILDKLILSGITKINISIDSLNRKKFHEITFHDRLNEILAGIQELLKQQISVSTNVVLLKNINDMEIDDFIEFTKDKYLSLRFIELMRTNNNVNYLEKHYLNPIFIIDKLLTKGWQRQKRELLDGPAVKFTHPDYKGSIGIISPYSSGFCDSCNRLRVSSRGDLHLCLFGDQSSTISLRPYLQSSSQKEQLIATILDKLSLKKETHSLSDGYSGTTDQLASIGG
mgnify:CR=1 FL=1